MIVLHHRKRYECPRTADVHKLTQARITRAITFVLSHIKYLNYLARIEVLCELTSLAGHSPRCTRNKLHDWVGPPSFNKGRDTHNRHSTHFVALTQKQIAELGFTDARGVLEDCVEYGLELTG